MLKNYIFSFCFFLGISSQAQIINIPDANFKNALVNTLCVGNPDNNLYLADADTNDDGEIQLSEALAVTKLKVSSQSIASLSGIENFQNLTSLICDSNQITTLNINSFFNLLTLSCSYNNMASLTITNCLNLNQLFCSGNLMTEIDLTSTTVSRCFIQSNPNLVSINLKNGIFMDSSYAGRNVTPGEGIPPPPPSRIEYNPNLVSICADDDEIEHIVGMNIFENNAALVVSSYCTTVPGGNYNVVSGTVHANCDTFPFPVPEIKVTYTNGSQTGHTFTGYNGSYLFFAPSGSMTITPEFSVPGYFTFSPSSIAVNFDGTGNTQDVVFCATPIGIHPNLEITIQPIGVARPGFDAEYRLLFKNKGYQAMSGTVTFAFNDTVSDFVLATPPPTAQSTNLLSWDFTNLNPFETRSIVCKLNINAPTETPAVNIGYQLDYTATISSSGIDETPEDNTALFKQTVVGSYDPNDKIVLEGQQISTAQTGAYLHYLVRFQNTGTFPADRVIVKDMLGDHLDWNTLEMVSSSHPYRSTLTNGNQLEVFYDGIHLPPSSVDEPGSNGYIAFKIKPKTSIAVGDIIDNTAAIYFDFNFPIVTNTVSTTVAALAAADFTQSAFVLHPNPAKDFVNLVLPPDDSLKKATIYNALGQKLLSTDSVVVDINQLSQGTYFISVETQNGQSTQKFVKL